MTARLITIPFSHYCDKGRWALQRCDVAFTEDAHLPLFHYLTNKRAGAGRTVPVVIDGATTLTDSTEIAAWADARKPGMLLPADPAERAEALAIEDELDRELGPATRRWAYFQLLPMRGADHYVTGAVPRWERIAFRAVRPLAVRMLQRRLNITPETAEQSRAKIDEQFAAISERIATRQYLVGDHFTIADLTFAALAAPALLPPKYPVPLPPLDMFSSAACTQIFTWRDTPAGRFALRLYAEER